MSAERLLAVATDHDKQELALVHNARVAAMRAYNERPGKETKGDWDAAREAYQETISRLTAVYFPEEAKAPEGERFKNRKQALNWLQAQGYKVSQGKFYGDCDAGFPAVHQDGTVSRYQVLTYGQQLDVERRGGTGPVGDREADDARRAKAAADIEEMKAEAMRRALDSEWLHADQAWAAVAAIVGLLDDGLKHEFFRDQGAIVHMAGGEYERGPQVYALCQEVIDRALTAVASRAEIAVTFAEGGEGNDDNG